MAGCGLAGSVPAEEFRALGDLLASAPPQVCFGQLSIMQLGYAATAALDGVAAARWARLAQLEQDIIHLSANGVLLLANAPLHTLSNRARHCCKLLFWYHVCCLVTIYHGECLETTSGERVKFRHG